MTLSSRLRAGVECAPWVIDEVRKLEAAATTDNHELRALVQDSAATVRRLAGVIRQQGTCAPFALESIADRLDAALLTRTEAGAHKGIIPEALDETINGVVSDLQMIAAGKDQVTGDPVSGLQSQRIAKSAHDRLLAAWNACEDAAPVAEGEAQEVIDNAPRAIELAERLVMAGPKAAHVSASETHELSEWVISAARILAHPQDASAGKADTTRLEWLFDRNFYVGRRFDLGYYVEGTLSGKVITSGHASHREAIDAAMQQVRESAP